MCPRPGTERRMRSRGWRFTVWCAFAAAWWVITCASAAALTLESPAAVLDTTDVTVTVAASEPTGTVWVLVDGAVAASRLAAPGSVNVFRDVWVGSGAKVLRGAVKHPGGVIYSAPVSVMVWRQPARPVMVTPSGGYGTATQAFSARAGAWTTSMTMYFNGRLVGTRTVSPGAVASFGTQSLPAGVSTVVLEVSNPLATQRYSYSVRRVDFPWATCIIIDKSEYRLYWVSDGQLVKVYPIAHGKPSTPTPCRTWKIGAKYITSPGSVYGPRKMRLFAQTSKGYVSTAYGIHGTNQPWVIGTMASHGCIRMYNRDVLELWPQVPLGTMVQTRQ